MAPSVTGVQRIAPRAPRVVREAWRDRAIALFGPPITILVAVARFIP